jgi:mycoredoxin
MSEKITLYGSDLCPAAPPVRSLMRRSGAPFDYVSISRNRAARQQVMDINQGNASVPTLVFPDGSTLTEPTMAALTAKIEALGHTIAPETLWQRVRLVLQTPSILLFGLAFFAIGVAAREPSLLIAGSVLLALALVGRVRM